VSKERLDVLMVARGLVESRNLAQRLVMAGQVRVNGQVVLKAATKVPADARLEIDHGPRFVSRGGDKLAAALQAFQIDVTGRVCADVGASTGGFSDCLLQAGARHVYAIDVGKGILHWKLRQDHRITVMESTNARYLENLPEPVDFVTIDASFISLRLLLPVVKNWFRGAQWDQATESPSELIALIKPQFEAGRKEAARGDGVIRDSAVHRRVLREVMEFALTQDFSLRGLLRSPVLGPKGNLEFLAWMVL
jgi:23S rRNA (cytidine1920-2'-O)/16S rRNA (cytidine1409-2'-O)-methyltransferase